MKLVRVLRWLIKPVHLWITVFACTIVAGVIVQFVLLPHVFPAWHDGFGLIRGVDGLKFHFAALRLAQAIEQHGWRQWVPQPEGQLVSGVAAVFYVLMYPAPWSVLPANALLNATACVCVYLLLAHLTRDNLVAITAATPFALFPSNLLWNAQFHNENYAVPGVIFILFGWLVIAQVSPPRTAPQAAKAAGAYILIGFGSLLLGLVRLYILSGMTYLFVAATLVLSVPWRARRLDVGTHLTRTVLLLAASTMMVLVVFALRGGRYFESRPAATTLTGNSTGAWVTSGSRFGTPTGWIPGIIDHQLEQIAATRRSLIRALGHGGTSIDLDVTFGNAAEVVAYLPRAVQISFLSPFPSLWFSESANAAGTAMRTLSAFEMLFVYGALLGLPVFVCKHRSEPSLWLILLVCTGMLTVYGLSVPNVGALYRFRYPFLMPLVCFGVAGWMSRIDIRWSSTDAGGPV